MFSLSGKTAIVTGGAHGIGKAASEILAQAGAWVLIVDIDDDAGQAAAESIVAAGATAQFCRADVASPDEVANAVRVAEQYNGRVDVLVNNAAYLGDFHDVQNSTPHEWDKCMKTALQGTHNFVQQVLPSMIRQKDGSIIIVSSIMALVGGPTAVAYMTAKAGLLGYMRSTAFDLGCHNIRVNAVCPGSIRTRISPQLGTEAHQWQVENTMLGRVGHPLDIAYAVAYLASDEANFVTGIVLPIDGGHTAK